MFLIKKQKIIWKAGIEDQLGKDEPFKRYHWDNCYLCGKIIGSYIHKCRTSGRNCTIFRENIEKCLLTLGVTKDFLKEIQRGKPYKN